MKDSNSFKFISGIVLVFIIVIVLVSFSTFHLAKGTYSVSVDDCHQENYLSYREVTSKYGSASSFTTVITKNGSTCYACPNGYFVARVNGSYGCFISCAKNTYRKNEDNSNTTCTACSDGYTNKSYYYEYLKSYNSSSFCSTRACYHFQCNNDNKWEKVDTEEFAENCEDTSDSYASNRDISGQYCNHCSSQYISSNVNKKDCQLCYCSWCDNGTWANRGLSHMTEGDCNYAGSSGRCSNYNVDATTSFGYPKSGSCGASVANPSSSGSSTDNPSSSSTGNPSNTGSATANKATTGVESTNPSTDNPTTKSNDATNKLNGSTKATTNNSNDVKNTNGVDKNHNITVNPPTGRILIAVSWIIGISIISYSFWYFKKIK